MAARARREEAVAASAALPAGRHRLAQTARSLRLGRGDRQLHAFRRSSWTHRRNRRARRARAHSSLPDSSRACLPPGESGPSLMRRSRSASIAASAAIWFCLRSCASLFSSAFCSSIRRCCSSSARRMASLTCDSSTSGSSRKERPRRLLAPGPRRAAHVLRRVSFRRLGATDERELAPSRRLGGAQAIGAVGSIGTLTLRERRHLRQSARQRALLRGRPFVC